MTRIWVCADHHIGHANILTFKDKNGELIRGKVFKDIKEHDQEILRRHNEVVKPEDHVYFLGDVMLNKRMMWIIRQFNGHKRLVMGNHDIFPVEVYLEAGFEKICASRVFPGNNLIFTHIPVHPDSLSSRGWTNVHGHTHSNCVLGPEGKPDNRYRPVSLEHIDYTPVLLMT